MSSVPDQRVSADEPDGVGKDAIEVGTSHDQHRESNAVDTEATSHANAGPEPALAVSEPRSGQPERVEQAVYSVDGVQIVEPEHEPYMRSAGDLLRVGVALGVFLVTLLAAAVFHTLVSGAAEDVVHLTGLVPAPVATALDAFGKLVGYLGPLPVLATLVVVRRLRVAIMVVAAGTLAGGAMWAISHALSFRVVLPADLGALPTITYPGSSFLASASAIVTVLGPWLPRILRRVSIVTVALVAITRISTAQYVPYEVAVAVMLGWLVGAIVLAVLGSPNQRPRGVHVVDALQRAGISLTRLEMLGRGIRGSTVYRAVSDDGTQTFVKVFSADQREADLLLQGFRWLRLRDASDERPFTSLRRSVEHEALLALKAADDGVPTARLIAVAEVEPDGMLLAFDFVEGTPLAGATPERLTDDMLRDVWRIAAALRSNHVAHRDLNLAHIIADGDAGPVVVDFSFGELAALPAHLRTDVAELLCSMAVEVGASRAVATALDVLGPDVLGDACGRVQPLALSNETRRALAAHDGLLEELQAEVQQAAGLEQVHYEELARIKPRTVLMVVVFTIVIYVMAPRVTEVQDMGGALSRASWGWIPPMAGFMFMTWVGATMGMIGSVPDRLPFWPMFKAQVAASFVDTLAPASVGGMALNTRFVQKRGVDPGVAVAGVGLNAVAGFIIHIVLLGGFILWAGSSGGDATSQASQRLSAPSGTTVLLVVGVLVALVALLLAIPWTRRLARDRVVPLVRDAVRGLGELARKPRKIAALFGGSVVVTFGFYGSLVCAVEAFGGGVTPAQIGVVYLVAFAVAILFPTPGGLGALEGALIAGFQRLGMSADAAVGSVLVFRTGTFFLPVVPGWVSFQLLQRSGDI